MYDSVKLHMKVVTCRSGSSYSSLDSLSQILAQTNFYIHIQGTYNSYKNKAYCT